MIPDNVSRRVSATSRRSGPPSAGVFGKVAGSPNSPEAGYIVSAGSAHDAGIFTRKSSESSYPGARGNLETFVTGGHGLLIPDVTARTATQRRERGTAAWVRGPCAYTCTHRCVLERYLWLGRHTDGNECPGFSDAASIIVLLPPPHPLPLHPRSREKRAPGFPAFLPAFFPLGNIPSDPRTLGHHQCQLPQRRALRFSRNYANRFDRIGLSKNPGKKRRP